jgi:hypothetical protein
VAKLGQAFEEADEARDWLVYLQEAGIAQDAALLQEAVELTKILAVSLRTARANVRQMKCLPNLPHT